MHRLLHNLLENIASPLFILYQSFSFSILALSVVLGVYDELKGFTKDIHFIVIHIEVFVSTVILFEYFGRLYLSKNRLYYLLHPLSLLDLIAIVPYFQPFRLLRYIAYCKVFQNNLPLQVYFLNPQRYIQKRIL